MHNASIQTSFKKQFIDGICIYSGILDSSEYPSKIGKDGSEWWYKNGIIHRDDDKPAVTIQNRQYWYINGKYHRDGDKPAIIYPNGRKEWFNNGVLHRENGKPAIEDPVRGNQYWVDGKQIS